MMRNAKILAFLLLGACGGSVTTGDDTGSGSGTGTAGDQWDQKLGERQIDYSAALRIAALRLTGELPKLVEVKAVGDAPDTQKKDVYQSLVRGYLDDPRFSRQMFAWWKDELKMGDA